MSKINAISNAISNAIYFLFEGNDNLILIEDYCDWISLLFKDVNEQPVTGKEINQFIEEGLLSKSIDLKQEGLCICFCDGNYVSVQPTF